MNDPMEDVDSESEATGATGDAAAPAPAPAPVPQMAPLMIGPNDLQALIQSLTSHKTYPKPKDPRVGGVNDLGAWTGNGSAGFLDGN